MNKNSGIYKIIVNDVSKIYKMYNTPMDRLKESLSISKKVRHNNFYALSDINFSIKKGEILGIVGRNGAGKSTLLKIITGVLTPSKGTVKIDGRISSLLELGTGFNLEYTGVENIYFYGTIMGFTKKQMDIKKEEIIQFAEIGDYVHQPVKTYSSGMFARLAFSCAINVEPDVLIVDEILSVGDMRFQAKCFNKFKEFQDKGVTILYVGHDVGMMRTFCDTTLWLNNGKMVDIGESSFVCAKYTEFMYVDEISEFTSYKIFERKTQELVNKENIEPTATPKKIAETIFFDSIAHWGSNTGLINYVQLLNKEEKEMGHFTPEETIKIIINFDIPEEIDLDFFSVAFSIKNKEGTDLIVKTTYDEELFFKESKKEQKIIFSLETHLAVGDYYIVVALENRKNASITYYEYIEGVKYFKIYTNKKIFGVIDAKVDIYLK